MVLVSDDNRGISLGGMFTDNCLDANDPGAGGIDDIETGGPQPYLGLGLNYTYFFDEEVNPVLAGFLVENLPELGIESAKLSLDDSFGVAVQAGVDVPLNEKWYFNAGVWWIDINTSADITLGLEGGSSAKVGFDVDIDPWVYNIGFSYKF